MSEHANPFPAQDAVPEVISNPNDPLLLSLQFIKERLDLPDGVKVVYPGSATHTTIADFFGKDNVVHVDPDKSACDALETSSYQAVATTIEDYQPAEPVDMIVTLNSYGSLTKDKVARLIKPDGYIVTNNYTHWATELAALTDAVELKAAILPAWNDAAAKYVEGGEIPSNATEIYTSYFKLDRGALTEGTSDDHDTEQKTPVYPDALFIFQRI